MKFFSLFRSPKNALTAAAPALQDAAVHQEAPIAQTSLQVPLAVAESVNDHQKPAIALITYCRADYFEKVLNSLLTQQIDNQPFSTHFDLYVFQDGLVKDAPAEDRQGHHAIAQLC